jgi:hypothetical protein
MHVRRGETDLIPADSDGSLVLEDVQGIKSWTHVVVLLPEQVSIFGIERLNVFSAAPPASGIG